MIIPVLGSQVENSAALVDVVHLLDDDLVILSKLTKAPPPRRRRRKVAAFPYAIIHHDCRSRNTRPRQIHVFAADIFQERVGPALEDIGERNVAETRRSTRCTASSAPLALSPRCRRRPCTSTFRRTNVLFPSRVFGTLRHIMAMRRRMMWLSVSRNVSKLLAHKIMWMHVRMQGWWCLMANSMPPWRSHSFHTSRTPRSNFAPSAGTME